MSSCRDTQRLAIVLMLVLLGVSPAAQSQDRYPGIGRPANAAELAAWDIDVRPDFKGLPPGRGSVADGQKLWEAQCAGCHGVFGESNEVFSPLVGGTTADDVKSGRVAKLRDPAYPQRSTLMKVSQLSTLWDYIRRAMPWTAPKTLTVDEVYALTAYLLHLGEVLPAEFELSNRNMAEVQARLPNRHGKTLDHAKWPGPEFGTRRQPDVQGSACMRDCATEPTLASLIPDHARNAHGNLAAQQRTVGPQRGATTETKPAPPTPQMIASATATPVRELLQKNVCVACHQVDTKAVGPSFREVAARHGQRADAKDYLAARIRQGGVGNWGSIPMPAQSLDEAEAQAIAAWLAAGAKP
jgi:cytochrome c551/c552